MRSYVRRIPIRRCKENDSLARDLYYGAEARKKLCCGVDRLADAVRFTLGPRGRNAVTTAGGAPTITNRGYSITKGFSLSDLAEDLGAQMLKQAAQKTSDAAGDGTTTAVVLAQALVREGQRCVAAGCSPMLLRRGLQSAAEAACTALDGAARRLEGQADTARVASAACDDEALGALMAQALEQVGPHGVITLGESRTLETQLEVVTGTQFDRGYLSPELVSDRSRMESVMERPYLLFTDKKIEALQDVLPIMDQAAQQKAPLLVVAEDISGEALKAMIINKCRGTVDVMAVRAPGFGERQKALVDDLALLTGATVIREAEGLSLREAKLSWLGRARQVTVTRDRTLIQGGAGDPAALEERAALLRRMLAAAEDEFAVDRARERLGKLASGVAVIRLGAATELELKEKKRRGEDALNALRSAAAEGIVPGGGAAYCAAIPAVEAHRAHLAQEDERAGARILALALRAPLMQIAENAGLDGSAAVEEALRQGPGVGLDVRTGAYVPMLQAGIMDPARVARLALQNAVSIAAALLTTEAGVVDPHDEAWLRAHGNSVPL